MRSRVLFSALVVLSLLISVSAMAQDKAPAKAPAKTATGAQTPPQPGMVWVNTGSKSKVYHKEGDRYYGKTKSGKFMTEADAKKAGYSAAKQGAVKASTGSKKKATP